MAIPLGTLATGQTSGGPSATTSRTECTTTITRAWLMPYRLPKQAHILVVPQMDGSSHVNVNPALSPYRKLLQAARRLRVAGGPMLPHRFRSRQRRRSSPSTSTCARSGIRGVRRVG